MVKINIKYEVFLLWLICILRSHFFDPCSISEGGTSIKNGKLSRSIEWHPIVYKDVRVLLQTIERNIAALDNFPFFIEVPPSKIEQGTKWDLPN